MNDCIAELEDSPSRVGNFLISYTNEADIIEDIHAENLIEFLNTNVDENIQALSNTDSSFFPRAFTDTELLRTDFACDTENVKSRRTHNLEDTQFYPEKANIENMAEKFGNSIGNYKPDVVLSNSHQRSGPDGSPALAPPNTQTAFMSNLSETGELFAPVRTLTFSDVDQNSQIEDSYMNSSRLVSTPNRDGGRSNQYDYSSMQNAMFQSVSANNYAENAVDGDSDSSDSDNGINMRNRSPQFRQLEGEADSDFQSTGPFHPSSHGLSKEFMDQFVGKTTVPGFNDNMDVFSPLGSNAFQVAERRMQVSTPPLHSPAPDSPLAKYAKGSPRSPYHHSGQKRVKQDDADEIQFDMSPTRSQHSARPFHREVIGYGPLPEYSHSASRQAELFLSDQDDYSFQPIPNHMVTQVSHPKNVPKNLNEYFEQHSSLKVKQGSLEQKGHTSKQNDLENEPDDDNDLDLDSRQGDGSDSDGDDGPHRLGHFQQHQHPNPTGASRSTGSLEQVIQQRMQVSVKLPQATYDTLSADTSHDDKFNGDHMTHKAFGKDCPPDIALSGAMGDKSKLGLRHSPEKVMDLLQNQSDNTQASADGTDVSEKPALNKNDHTAGASKTKDFEKAEKTHFVNTGEQHRSSMSENLEKQIEAKELSSSPLDNNQNALESFTNAAYNRGTKQYIPQNPATKPVPGQGATVPVQTGSQSQIPVSSRLLQETVSQRNKTTQKYVSNAPVTGKSSSTSQTKEFKKPQEVPPKNPSVPTVSQGARKTLLNDQTHKFKVSDKVKPKTVSSENLASKQRTSGNVQQPRSGLQASASNSSHGHINRGQGQRDQSNTRSLGHLEDDGHGHNGSLHSIEDGGESNRLVTQVQTTSPVPVEVPEQTLGPVKVRGAMCTHDFYVAVTRL